MSFGKMLGYQQSYRRVGLCQGGLRGSTWCCGCAGLFCHHRCPSISLTVLWAGVAGASGVKAMCTPGEGRGSIGTVPESRTGLEGASLCRGAQPAPAMAKPPILGDGFSGRLLRTTGVP